MTRNAFRKELTALLSSMPCDRPPVIRRSLHDAWLYATDLPILFDGTVPDEAGRSLKALGWEYAPEREWLQLRKEAPEPPEDWFTGLFGKEAACCLSLLDRHDADRAPEDPDEETVNLRYRLIKAGEEGPEAYERLCGAIHGEWAARLRQHRALPLISRTFFGGQSNRR